MESFGIAILLRRRPSNNLTDLKLWPYINCLNAVNALYIIRCCHPALDGGKTSKSWTAERLNVRIDKERKRDSGREREKERETEKERESGGLGPGVGGRRRPADDWSPSQTAE